MSVNRATVLGNLGRDPELRYAQGGSAICNLTIATSRKWKNKHDQWQEETEWHRVVVFGRTAESCNEHLVKGRQVYVEGRIQTKSYDDKDGVKRYSTEIVADVVQFLGGGKGDDARKPPPSEYDPGNYSQPGGDDDLPF